ncbi:MAG TPA: hypothetical protein VHS34_17240 [Terriglobales bacterium]|jgi:hypothetical protein|nr:hypothetical protein [Terriglobales bacterium]
MPTINLRNGNSPVVLTFVLAVGTLLVLPGCDINVKKGAEGKDKKVDIETPIGALHVSQGADVRDIGLPVYPGARRKEVDDDGQEKSANVNISSSLFGLRVVAIEYLSDDPPEKLVAYYSDQLKKYGSVLECHTSKSNPGATMNPGDDSKDSEKLKCEGDNNGKVIELKVGTEKNQRIVSIQPANSGKGSDFGLVYVQMRGGKETI